MLGSNFEYWNDKVYWHGLKIAGSTHHHECNIPYVSFSWTWTCKYLDNIIKLRNIQLSSQKLASVVCHKTKSLSNCFWEPFLLNLNGNRIGDFRNKCGCTWIIVQPCYYFYCSPVPWEWAYLVWFVIIIVFCLVLIQFDLLEKDLSSAVRTGVDFSLVLLSLLIWLCVV